MLDCQFVQRLCFGSATRTLGVHLIVYLFLQAVRGLQAPRGGQSAQHNSGDRQGAMQADELPGSSSSSSSSAVPAPDDSRAGAANALPESVQGTGDGIADAEVSTLDPDCFFYLAHVCPAVPLPCPSCFSRERFHTLLCRIGRHGSGNAEWKRNSLL